MEDRAYKTQHRIAYEKLHGRADKYVTQHHLDDPNAQAKARTLNHAAKLYKSAAEHAIEAGFHGDASNFYGRSAEFLERANNHDAATEARKHASEEKGRDDRKRHDITERLRKGGIFAIAAAFIGAGMFLGPNITGNIINSTSKVGLNIFGGLLFILGLIGLIFVFRKK